MTKVLKIDFEFESPIGLETSMSATIKPLASMVKSKMHIEIDDQGDGYADWDIEELDFEESIGLWFEGNQLTDYDGVMEIPKQLLDKLEEQGYFVEDMR